jgi:quercetin dioxygenase-like cupin family protein
MLECTITETKDVEPVVYEWGAVKWVANRELNPGCEQSCGLVHILPGKVNPEHWHTAAEEIVHMLQGECDAAGRPASGDRAWTDTTHPAGHQA